MDSVKNENVDEEDDYCKVDYSLDVGIFKHLIITIFHWKIVLQKICTSLI